MQRAQLLHLTANVHYGALLHQSHTVHYGALSHRCKLFRLPYATAASFE